LLIHIDLVLSVWRREYAEAIQGNLKQMLKITQMGNFFQFYADKSWPEEDIPQGSHIFLTPVPSSALA
jgi:hypothetical protein